LWVCRKDSTLETKQNVTETDTSMGSKFKILFSNINLYLTFVAYGFFILRLQTVISWLSGGWPEWVATGNHTVEQLFQNDSFDEDVLNQHAEEFNTNINTVNSVLGITLIFFNAIPGLIVDGCCRKYTYSKGMVIGNTICFAISASFLVSARYGAPQT